jgi:hypothetical protein
MIDLCKIFGVEEEEKFRIEKCEWAENTKYVIQDNYLMVVDSDNSSYKSCLELNDLVGCEIIKLPKKKEFTDDELAIMRSLPKEYEWIARDTASDSVYIFKEKPSKNEYGCWISEGNYCILVIFNHLFQSIQWEDEEPVYIDDYVERGVE